MSNDDRTRASGARAPSAVTENSVHLSEIRNWRQAQENNYNRLVTFIRELSQTAPWMSHDSGWVIDEHWKQDAEELLRHIEGGIL